jgi:Zn-dependent peptidase ImmA (M78 family)/transcriptional regulator with XRE-family HTH domain
MIAGLNPEIITWARKRCGLSVEDLAYKVNRDVAEIRMWEKGQKAPPYTVLQDLAYKHFKVPLAIFFFPEPPSIDDPVTNFRRLPEFELKKFSSDTRHKIRVAQAYQDSIFELYPKKRTLPIRDLFAVTHQTLPKISQNVRKYLGISLAQQYAFPSTDVAFKAWRRAVELRGIFTFKDSFQDKFISGFCLLNETYPIIMINNSNSFTRQIFTLVHELGHILLGIHGVTDTDEMYLNFMNESDRRAEIACNHFAAEILVPLSAFRTKIGNKSPDDPEVISELADQFSVSREVILRRFLDEDEIGTTYYLKMAKKWNRDYLRGKREKSGGNWYLTKLSYLGEGYTRLAFERFRRGVISAGGLAGHLNVKAKNLGKLQTYLER